MNKSWVALAAHDFMECMCMDVRYEILIQKIIPGLFVIWGFLVWYLGIGWELLYYSGFVFIFGVMVAEDYWWQTVDDRWVLSLCCWVFVFRVLFGQGLNMVMGTVVGGFLGFLFYVFGLREKKTELLQFEEKDEEGLSFLPCLAVAIGLWFLIAPNEGIKWYFTCFLMVLTEHQTVLGVVTGVVFVICMVRFLSRFERKMEEGFGAGDSLVLTVLGGFLGWQALLVVFFMALVVFMCWFGVCELIKNVRVN